MIKKLTLLSTAIFVLQLFSIAQNDSRNLKDLAAGCLPPSAYAELNINNVRARINNGGDMWWDLTSNSEYEIPKGSGRTSMFAGAIWIGGLDNNNQIRLAAQRYRGNGNDFFPGPLSTDGSASIEDGECIKYDVIHTLYKKDVEQFVTWFENPNAYPGYIIPQYFFDYPAHGDLSKGQSFYLAPFFDYNSDGKYNPYDGDYPYYDLSNALCRSNFPTQEEISGYVSGNSNLADQVLKGDQTLWWVFNDKGNTHTETQGQSIGIEIRAQAYAYQSHDEINNATFYSYEIINRSPNKLSETFIGFFIDPDLGGSKDDYIGSDVLRGLGYCYNGDSYDDDADGAFGYGINPPAIGVDFFQGPYMNADGIDNPEFRVYSDSSGSTIIENCNEAINGQNFGNGIIDDERYGMTHFVYFNGTGTVPPEITQPDIALDYYNFMRSVYKDNSHMIYGGNGSTSSGGYGPDCNFMFPGESDPCDYNTGGIAPNGPRLWTETTAGNQPYDRRFLVSTGPFSLEAGEVNYVTVGVPWGRSLCGGPEASIDMLRIADDKIQRLFDNCFYIMSGPDAPDLTIQEMDQEIILFLSNNAGNNLNENYSEIDPSIVSPDSLPSDQRYDSLFRFEGYQVFQLKDATVTADDLDNSDLARLVAQCDIKNSVSQILNYEYSADLGALVPIEKVDGENAGIIHSFRLFHDLFTPGNSRLINNKKYYYMVVAYAFNEYEKYSPDPAWQFAGEASLYGQQTPYLRSKKNMGVYTAIPHIPIVENDGTISNADYGDEPKITRIEGQGNGGHIIDLVSTSISDIFDNNFSPELTYINGFGPITVKVVDPLNVVNANYILRFDTLDYNVDTANWILEQYDASMNLIQTFASDHDISYYNEQVFPELGISITICQSLSPGDITHVSNGFLDASIGYPNSSGTWLSGVADVDGKSPYNWIRSGITEDDGSGYGDYAGIDPSQDYEKILGGTWAPYRLCASHADNPV
ncbi:MAG: hypothetical protein JXR53_08485, partial [Bacteroidales bacterium]|nr:hypothetical protein [Bacteroidales bacterium]